MPQAIRLGLVGYGFHGQIIHRAAHLVKDDVKIVAILDHNKKSRSVVGNDGSHLYSQLEPFLERQDLDAVIIATPARTHLGIVANVAHRGLPIMLEKPISSTYQEAKAIVAVARRARIKFMVGLTSHYRPEMILAARLLSDGKIGEIQTIHEEIVIGLQPFPMNYVARSNDGGVLLENGIHLLDHLMWFGGPINKVAGASVGKRFLEGYYEDVCMFQAVHDSKILSQGHLQWMPYKEAGGFRLMVYGSSGCLEVRGLDSVRVNIHGRSELFRLYDTGGSNYIDSFSERHLPGLVGQIRDFLAYIRDEKVPEVSTEHALEAHSWIDKIYRVAKKPHR